MDGHWTQKNPHPPTLKAQLKLHKPEISIRPLFNNRSAPSYKMAKKLNDILKQYLNLNNYYTVDKSTNLAHNLTKLTINDNYRLITLDIKDLYVNIPIGETIRIARTQLLIHNDQQTTNQICTLLKTILGQNHFTFQDHCYQPDKGVAMGSPLSGVIAEIFLHLEDSHIKLLLDSKCIAFYSRYVDIIIIYDATCTDPETIVQHANITHSNLQLTPTLESNNQISFLDLLITRKSHQVEIDLYCKLTMTDTTINSYLTTQ